MAIALVKLGTAASGTGSAAPTFGQATTAGNLLVCWMWSSQGGTFSITGASGWTVQGSQIGDCGFAFKENCGASETPPTVNQAGAATVVACLGEFSGVATVNPHTTDASQNLPAPTTSPIVVAVGAADAASGYLMITSMGAGYTMAGTKTTTDTYNNGATATNAANNDATSTTSHYRFAYGITTSNAAADQDSFAFTITNISAADGILAVFKTAAAGGADILDPMGASGFFGQHHGTRYERRGHLWRPERHPLELKAA